MVPKVKKKKVRARPKSHDHTGSIVEETMMFPVQRLSKFHKNPNIGDPEKTAESLRVNGQYRSIVVNKGTKTGRQYEVLAGNHTLMGAKRLVGTRFKLIWWM